MFRIIKRTRLYSTGYKVGDLVSVSHNYRPFTGVIIDTPTPANAYYTSIEAYGHTRQHFKQDVNLSSPSWAFLPKIQKVPAAFTPPVGLNSETKLKLENNDLPIHISGHLVGFQKLVESETIRKSRMAIVLHSKLVGKSQVISLEDAAKEFFGLSKDGKLNDISFFIRF